MPKMEMSEHFSRSPIPRPNMTTYQTGMNPVEALARPGAAATVAGPRVSFPVLPTALGARVTPDERSTARLLLAQYYRPGTTQQVPPMPVPQSPGNRGGGYQGYAPNPTNPAYSPFPAYSPNPAVYPPYSPSSPGGYLGNYNQNRQISIYGTISKDGISGGLQSGPAQPIYNLPGTQATYHMVVRSWSDYRYYQVKAGGFIPPYVIPIREYQWYNPFDWFLSPVG
ncbi:MAG: hypothetical protein H7Z43_10935 [Clostridia bacterium]|nr:hypothetical protein [Deltaproteobacteria bacterium]